MGAQESTGCGEYGNPGSVPGTSGCGFPGLYGYGTLGRSDREVPGGFGAFGLLSGLLILLQQFSGEVCRVLS